MPDPAGPDALPFARLTGPARASRTWLLEPPRLLPALAEDLAAAGVGFRARSFGSVADVARLAEPVVVNCTGYGARALWGDERLVPQRGHLVVLERPSERHDYLLDGGCAGGASCYVFCRSDDLVVGGTVVPGDERATPVPRDEEVFARILANAAAVFDGRPDRCRA